MAQSVSLAYKSEISTGAINQKFDDFMQKNIVFDGFKVVVGSTGLRLSIDIGNAKSFVYIKGVSITETAKVVDVVTLPGNVLDKTYFVYMQYTHALGAVATYGYVLSPYVATSSQVLLAQIDIPANATAMLTSYITDKRLLTTVTLAEILSSTAINIIGNTQLAEDVKVGSLEALSTVANSSVVSAINEINSTKANASTTIAGYGITDAYTKTEIDGKTGTLSTLTTTSKILAPAINEVKASVDAINATSQTQPLTIPHGLSIVTTDRETPINALAYTGRTLINLLGRDGNCEDVSKWGAWQTTLSLDTANFVCGSNGIKITLTSSVGSMYKTLASLNIDITKYYLISAYVRNGNATSVSFNKDATGGGVQKTGGLITSTSAFSNTHAKCQPSDFVSTNQLAFQIIGTPGQYAYVDAINVYEISQATYNLIDVDPEYTGDKLAEKYPYVDSYQVLQNPAVTVQGKNLLPPFYQWSTVTLDGLVISPYVMSFVKTDTSSYQGKFVNAPVIAGQNYVFSITVTSSGMGGTVGRGAYLEIYFYDDYGVSTGTKLVQDMLVVNGTVNIAQSITPPTGTKVIRVNLTTQHTVTGTFTFTNPMLNLGSTALPFEPADPSYKYFPCKLADGETLQEIDGRWVKTKKIQDVVLDGSLGFTYSGTITGVKKIALSLPVASNALAPNIIKYDGKIIKPYSTGDSSGDIVWYSSTIVEVWISSADSGWGDAYTQTADEIKAYFYGWRMCNTDGSPYTSGTKGWNQLYSGQSGATPVTMSGGGITISSTYTTTLPTAPNTTFSTNYNQLHYTLAKPTTEIIIPEGSLNMHDGANQVGLSEGIVVRESVVPQLYNGFWRICDTEITASNTKYRNKSLLAIYKNGIMDNHNWTIENNLLYSYGLFRAYTSTNFDPTAFYEVTYEVLDKYLYTTNALTATGTYDTNDHTVLGHTVEKVSEVETRVSVVERGKANAQQPNWIAPTLLNGWVNYGGINDTVAYFKDSLGMIHLKGFISGGTLGVSAFPLPVGYRPLLAATFATVANNAIGAITVTSSGGVIMGANGLGTGWFSLSSIPPFRAEQ